MVDMQQDHNLVRLLDHFVDLEKIAQLSLLSPFAVAFPTLVFFIINSSFLHQKLGFLVCWIIELERKSSPLEVTNLLLSFCWFKLLEFRVLLFVFLRKILRNLVLISFWFHRRVHE
jgi:hypothetical protein